MKTGSKPGSALVLKVQPNAGCDGVVGRIGDVWKIRIAAPADKGKANKKLIKFLADLLGTGKDNVMLIKGHTSHTKIVLVQGMNESEISDRLEKAQN